MRRLFVSTVTLVMLAGCASGQEPGKEELIEDARAVATEMQPLAESDCDWLRMENSEGDLCVASACSDGCWAIDCVFTDGTEYHEIADSCNA